MKNPLSVFRFIILFALASFSLSSFADWPYLYCVTATPPSNSDGYREINYNYLYENRSDMFKDFVAKYGSSDKDRPNVTQVKWSAGYNYLQIFVEDERVVTLPKANGSYNAGRLVYNYKKDRKPSVLTFKNINDASTFCRDVRQLCIQLWQNDWHENRDAGKVTRASYPFSMFSLVVLYQEKNNATGDLVEKPMVCSPPTDFNGSH